MRIRCRGQEECFGAFLRGLNFRLGLRGLVEGGLFQLQGLQALETDMYMYTSLPYNPLVMENHDPDMGHHMKNTQQLSQRTLHALTINHCQKTSPYNTIYAIV